MTRSSARFNRSPQIFGVLPPVPRRLRCIYIDFTGILNTIEDGIDLFRRFPVTGLFLFAAIAAQLLQTVFRRSLISQILIMPLFPSPLLKQGSSLSAQGATEQVHRFKVHDFPGHFLPQITPHGRPRSLR